MTSRPAAGVPRPPKRSLSNSSLSSSQRPSHRRSLSQQFLPVSPIRKESSFLDLGEFDLPADAPSTAQGSSTGSNRQYGSTPRRAGSRLRLELSSEAMLLEPSSIESSPSPPPQTLTPARIMPPETTLPDSPQPLSLIEPGSAAPPQFDRDNPPMPFPKRRRRFFEAGESSRDAEPPAPALLKDGRPKPYSLDPPAEAPAYHPQLGKTVGKGASKAEPPQKSDSKSGPRLMFGDYFPWLGTHPEDKFSDNVIRHGFFDKGPTGPAETSSAKSSLYPALKHKSGLTALSNVFVSILQHRRQTGAITALSTFKPPPRVTLTDTKRENWLRDLANPAMPLRKLSRTIPHGIRGKLLFDQCMNKRVPAERAVWLARCVGANEIRASKRKGVNGTFIGGEAAWVREWTLNLERFLESVIFQFEEEDWRAKTTYATRLATNLYEEQLLDRDHYLDWVLSSLEGSPISKLPMWILVAQLYWKDLLCLRKTGRRLVAVLLGHYANLFADPDRDVYAELSTQLHSLITPLLTSNPENFVSPATWNKFRDPLLASLPEGASDLRAAFDAINLRNERLDAWRSDSGPSPRQELVKLLDGTLQEPFNDEVASSCWKTCSNRSTMVETVLEWCVSLHRPGLSKIYVGATLLRTWSLKGLDTTDAVLAFLDAPSCPQEAGQKKLLYYLVSELVRSGHFSVARYIQWLISRGGLYAASETHPSGHCATRLLVELPVHCLTSKMQDLRGNLLRRVGYSVHDEATDFEVAARCFRHTLGLPLEGDDPMRERKPIALSKLCRRVHLSSRPLQTWIGNWLQEQISTACDQKYEDSKELDLSTTTFDAIRTILESADDFSKLADVIKAVVKVGGPEILASCADTVNIHLHTFAGMGLAADVFASLIERLKAIGDTALPPRPLLAALASLAERLPGVESMASQLRAELLRSDRNNAIAVCSPVSDNMVTQLQDAEGDLQEEIERLRAANTSVDPQTMDRLFDAVVYRLETYWAKANDRQRWCNLLLASLRAKDPSHFDVRMGQWLSKVINLTLRPQLIEVLPLLVGIGCVSPALILSAAARYTAKADDAGLSDSPNTNPTAMQEVLQLLTMPVGSDSGMIPEECCRFTIYQKTAQAQLGKELLRLIRDALVEFGANRQDMARSHQPLEQPQFQEELLDILRLQTLADYGPVVGVLGVADAEPAVKSLIDDMATRLLLPGDPENSPIPMERILEVADDFTMPFCKVKLALTFKLTNSMAPDGVEPPESHVVLLSRAIERAVDAQKLQWTETLPCLSDEVTIQLKSWARSRFFEMLPSVKNPHIDPTSMETIRTAESLLSVVRAMIEGRPPPKTAQLIAPMVDKLTELWQMLASSGDDKLELRCVALNHWIPAFLTFVTFHATSTEPGPSTTTPAAQTPGPMRPPPLKASDDVRGRLILVLAGLILELQRIDPSDRQQTADRLAQRTLDVALHLVDGLTDEARAACAARLLANKDGVGSSPSDWRLRYLFSYSAPALERFALARKDPAAVAAAKEASTVGAAIIDREKATKPPEAWYGMAPERLTPYPFKRWELLSEFTPNVGENDTSLNLRLFEANKLV